MGQESEEVQVRSAMMPVDRTKMRAQLDLHEGRRKKPYEDTVGKLTIGVGHNLTDRGLSDRIIDLILDEDINEHWKELVAVAPWIVSLSEVRQRVLLDMAFNLGVPSLMTFKQTLSAVKNGDYWLAAQGMLASKWARQVGARATRLATMMETGNDYH